MTMFKGLDNAAFLIWRICDPAAWLPINRGLAWALCVATGFPNYREVWGQRR